MTHSMIPMEDHPGYFKIIEHATGAVHGANLPLDEARGELIKWGNPELYRYCHDWFTEHISRLDWLIYTGAAPRWKRAIWLLHMGAVTPNGSPLDYYVQSQTAPNIKYRVRLGNGASNPYGNWLCTMADHPNRGRIHDHCPDTDTNRGGRAPDLGHGPRCKHMIAAAIAHQFPEVLTLAYKESPTAATVEPSEIPPAPRSEDLTPDSSTDWARIKAWAQEAHHEAS